MAYVGAKVKPSTGCRFGRTDLIKVSGCHVFPLFFRKGIDKNAKKYYDLVIKRKEIAV